MKALGLASGLALALTGCVTVAHDDISVFPFRDCGDCPEMGHVPRGTFTMGSPPSEQGRFDDEGPQRQVVIPRILAVSRTPVTRAQYERFVTETGRPDAAACSSMSDQGEWVSTLGLNWRSPGFAQMPDHPVVCVSWDDATAYAAWLSAKTGARYRLLSEAEFEYAARAGTATVYPWGNATGDICTHANGFDLAAKREHADWPSLACDDGAPHSSPVASYRSNAFNLFDMTGNVFQWVQDCFVERGYAGAPADGSARESPACRIRVIRGGSWLNGARGLRAAMRDRDPQQGRYTNIGIRIARDL